MTIVFPSQVVSVIDEYFPEIKSGQIPQLHAGYVPHIKSIISLSFQIREELLIIRDKEYAYYILGLEALNDICSHWSARRDLPIPQNIAGKHPLEHVRDGLCACPDTGILANTPELSFIEDLKLRESIKEDVSSSNAALLGGNWKAATVIAGSAIEALLLWSIKKHPNLASLNYKPTIVPEKWVLDDYIKVSKGLNIIKENTSVQVGLAKEFRNLIHPGKAQRTSQSCTRGTALAALASLELVISDLS